jgi:hypothetical protein
MITRAAHCQPGVWTVSSMFHYHYKSVRKTDDEHFRVKGISEMLIITQPTKLFPEFI